MQTLTWVVLLAALATTSIAHPQEALPTFEAASDSRRVEARVALGFHIDLFPTLVSAVNGKLGYAPQAWVGVDRVRLRFIAAHLEPPDALAFADAGFENPRTTVVAGVVDYTFGDHFDGFWVCLGLERWWRSIEHEKVPQRAEWSSTVATSGAGYTWRFTEMFYLDPWVGMHWTLDPAHVRLGPHAYEPLRLVANGSMKIGAMFDL